MYSDKMLDYVIKYIDSLGFKITRNEAQIILEKIVNDESLKGDANINVNMKILIGFVSFAYGNSSIQREERATNGNRDDVFSVFNEKYTNRTYIFAILKVKEYLINSGKYAGFKNSSNVTSQSAIKFVDYFSKNGYDYGRLSLISSWNDLPVEFKKWINNDLLLLKSTRFVAQAKAYNEEKQPVKKIKARVKKISLSQAIIAGIIATFIISNTAIGIKAGETVLDWSSKLLGFIIDPAPYVQMTRAKTIHFWEDENFDKAVKIAFDCMRECYDNYPNNKSYDQIYLYKVYEKMGFDDGIELMNHVFRMLHQHYIQLYNKEQYREFQKFDNYLFYVSYVYRHAPEEIRNNEEYKAAVSYYESQVDQSLDFDKKLKCLDILRRMLDEYGEYINNLEKEMKGTAKQGMGRK